MARIIEAEARISGTETLSPVLAKLAAKLEQLGKTAKTAGNVDKMAASLAKVNSQMLAMEKFNASKIGFQGAREKFRQTEQAVIAAARAMKTAEGPAGQLAAAYKRAQSAVAAASRQFENQKSALIGAKRALDGFGVPINRVVSEQQRLTAAVTRANSALDRQAVAGRRAGAAVSTGAHPGGLRNFLTRGEMRGGGMLGLLAGPAILHATKEAVTSGAHVQSKIVEMRNAGIPEADIERQTGRSMDLAAQYPNVNRSDILQRYKELRSVVLHPKEADELLETVVKTNSALNALDTTGHSAEGLIFAIKGAEVLGRAQDPKKFAGYLESFVKAGQVMGKTISPEMIYDLATNLKASGPRISDRFLSTTALSMAQEMGGPRTGVGIDQFIKQIVGGFQGQQHAAAKEFVSLGLANKDDFLTTKTGEIKGFKPGRHIANWELAMTDPDKYVFEKLLPAMEKHGITDLNAQIAEVRRLFTSSRSADVVSKMITQRKSFENHAKLYQAALGMDAAIGTSRADAFVGLKSLTTMLNSFAGVVTSPMMRRAADMMTDMALGIGQWGVSLAHWQKKHPQIAETAAVGGTAIAAGVGGYLTLGLINSFRGGFGLKGSALALDGSAAALGRAAAALGAGGIPGKVATAATGGVATAGVAGALTKGAILRGAPIAAAIYELNDMNKDSKTKDQPLRTWWRSFFGLEDPKGPAPWRPGGDFEKTPDEGERDWSGRSVYDGPYDRKAIPDRPSYLKPGANSIWDDPSSHVEAKLTGEAKVTGEARITIDIPGLPSRTVNVPLNGTVNANGPGSLGVSSPDAAAHRGGIGHN